VATRNATALTALGFKVGTVGNADPTSQTVVEYPAGQQAQAAVVAAKVSGATTSQSSAVSQVTLVLGTDGLAVAGASSSTTPTTPASGSTPSGVTNAADTGACIN
jgi:hypothetical protein